MAASSSRPQKLAKLQQFKANLPHHSQTSLHAMIAEAKKTGLPDYSSPKEQRDARRFLLNQCDGGAMGPVLPGCLPRSVIDKEMALAAPHARYTPKSWLPPIMLCQ